MTLDLTKRDPNLIKTIIFEIAKNNDVALSDIVKNTTLNYQTVKNQINFLFDSGLLEKGRTEKDIKRGKGHEVGDSIKSVNFNPNIQTFQDIAKIFDNKELSKFMASKYYQDNIKDYLTNLINSMEENKLYPLPNTDYLEYALRNSPLAVRYFLIDNDLNILISIHKRTFSLLNKDFRSTPLIDEEFKRLISNKYNEKNIIADVDGFGFPLWEQAIYYKIQVDAITNTLLNPNDDFAEYSPMVKTAISMIRDNLFPPETKEILKRMLDAAERKE